MSDLKDNLENVFWLGGSPCAGKSSISTVLGNRFDLNIYHVDEAFDCHSQHLNPVLHPALTKWTESSWNQRWTQPVDSLIKDVIACYREHFSMIVEDILSIPKDKPVLVEGTALLPSQIAEVIPTRNRAIWVVPTADFQLEYYSKREWVCVILEQCADAEAAFQNWMERDSRFASWVAAEVTALGLEFLEVDDERTVEENAMAVAAHFHFI